MSLNKTTALLHSHLTPENRAVLLPIIEETLMPSQRETMVDLRTLAAAGQREVTTQFLAEYTGKSIQYVSVILGVLFRAGLVTRTKSDAIAKGLTGYIYKLST